MRSVLFVLAYALVAPVVAACNAVPPGDCPDPSAIVPNGACSGDNLECAYTLQSPSPACDGTQVDGGYASSCTCMSGSWVCPAPVVCSTTQQEAGSGDDAGADDAGGDDATDAASGDATGDAGSDARAD